MSDLRKLVAETHAQRPKTDTAGMVDGLYLHTGEIDGEEERGKSKFSLQFVKCSYAVNRDIDALQNFLKKL